MPKLNRVMNTSYFIFLNQKSFAHIGSNRSSFLFMSFFASAIITSASLHNIRDGMTREHGHDFQKVNYQWLTMIMRCVRIQIEKKSMVHVAFSLYLYMPFCCRLFFCSFYLLISLNISSLHSTRMTICGIRVVQTKSLLSTSICSVKNLTAASFVSS